MELELLDEGHQNGRHYVSGLCHNCLFPIFSKDWKSNGPSILKGKLILFIMLQEVNVTPWTPNVKSSCGIHTSELEHMVYFLLLGLGKKEE